MEGCFVLKLYNMVVGRATAVLLVCILITLAPVIGKEQVKNANRRAIVLHDPFCICFLIPKSVGWEWVYGACGWVRAGM